MLKILISISVLLGTVSPLRCYSCDDETPCSAPFPIDCLQNSTCYTVMENEKVIVKGCARSCDHVPLITNSSTCQSCHQRDFCNGPEQGIGHNVHREHHRMVNGSVEITNDTVVNVRTYVVQAVKRPSEEQPCSICSDCHSLLDQPIFLTDLHFQPVMLVGKTFLITLFALFEVATSIKCLSCDSDIFNCTNHVSIDCPNHSKCYTLTKNGTEVLAKGCTHSCNFVTFRSAAYCKECYHTDYCNGPGVAIGSSGFISYWSPRGYDIGVTVRIQSAAHKSVFIVLMAFLVFLYLL